MMVESRGDMFPRVRHSGPCRPDDEDDGDDDGDGIRPARITNATVTNLSK